MLFAKVALFSANHNPLSSVRSSPGNCRKKDVNCDSDTRETLLTAISEETDRLASPGTNVLNMGKIEAGVWKPEKAPRNIWDIINETLD